MHKLSLIILALVGILIPINLSSRTISLQKARAIAENYMNVGISTRTGTDGVKLVWDSNSLVPNTKGTGQSPTFYVFSASKNGFVIIAGDDALNPILGYSFTGRAPESTDVPPALKMWLEDIDSHISGLRNSGYAEILETKSTAYNTKAGEEIIHLETAKWGQHAPFNIKCPMDGDKQSITGCTATAAAIIMQYHKWPDSGTGSTAAYNTSTKGIPVPARNFNRNYNWEIMPYEFKEGSYTTQQAEEVANLMADLGAAYSSDYSSTETLAIMGFKPLFKYFKYSSGMSTIARVDFLKEKFDKILKRELHSLRPVLYSGKDKNNNGHAFVIDGYDSNDFFHINWGWDGKSNGYYAITEHTYSVYQQAHINIMPEKGTNTRPEYWITFAHDGLKSSVKEYYTGIQFNVTAIPNNRTVADFDGYVRLGITDKNGNVKEWISGENRLTLKSNADYNSFYYYTSTTFSCKITCRIEIGDRIRMYFRERNTANWNLVIADPKLGEGVAWEIPLSDLYTIRESTSIKYDRLKKTITVSFKDGVSVSVLQNGTPVSSGISKTGNSVVVDLTELSGEKYLLRLEKGAEMEEVVFSVKSIREE